MIFNTTSPEGGVHPDWELQDLPFFVLLAAILEIRPLSIHGGSGGNRSETSLYRSGAVMPKNIVVFSDGTGQEGGIGSLRPAPPPLAP